MNMKKLLFTASLLLMGALGMLAQTERPRLLIEDFTKTSSVTGENGLKMRHAVIDALTKLHRFDLVDAVTIADLEPEMAKLQRDASDYIVNGTILSMSMTEESKKGKTQYGCNMSYSLTVTDTKNQGTVGTRTFEETTSNIHDTKDEAINWVAKELKNNLENFIIEILPIEGTVNPADYEAKKDKLEKCYINLGSNCGAKKGDKFKIVSPTTRAGKVVYNKIGELKIEEVVDGELSYCKVTKDGKKVLVAMEAYAAQDEQSQAEKPLKVVQIVDTGFFGTGIKF